MPSLASILNEAQRDALLAYYLAFVNPDLKTVGDLYDYLLMDPAVSEVVETTRVAEAIAAVQQYLYGLVANLDQGIADLDVQLISQWRSTESRYAVWAANMELQNYPENYISPFFRMVKSRFFIELEQTLAQGDLDPDAVADAMGTYLNEFANVADLFVVNGYIDRPLGVTTAADTFNASKYYFLGRSRDQHSNYYWRSMDLSLNSDEPAGEPITPNCWSDWLPINLPLSDSQVLPGTIRPVYEGGRLYVTWAEQIFAHSDPAGINPKVVGYCLKLSYLRFDGGWSPAIQAMMLVPNEKGGGWSFSQVYEPTTDDIEYKDTAWMTQAVGTSEITRIDGQGASSINRTFIGLYHMLPEDPNASVKVMVPTLRAYTSFNSGLQYENVSSSLLALLNKQLCAELTLNWIDEESFSSRALEFSMQVIFDVERICNAVQPEEALTLGRPALSIFDDTVTVYHDLAIDLDNLTVVNEGASASSQYLTGYGLVRSDDGLPGMGLQYTDAGYVLHNTVLAMDISLFGIPSVESGDYYLRFWYQSSGGISNCDFLASPMKDPYKYLIHVDSSGFMAFVNGGGPARTELDLSGIPIAEGGLYALQWYAVVGPVLEKVDSDPFGPPKFRPTYRMPAFLSGPFGSLDSVRGFLYQLSGDFQKQVKWDPEESDKYTYSFPKGSQRSVSFDFTFKDLPFTINSSVIMSTETVVAEAELPQESEAGQWRQFWTFHVTCSTPGAILIDKLAPNAALPIPAFRIRYDDLLGRAQFISFNDPGRPEDTRLGTTFARKLIVALEGGVSSLLNYHLQAEHLEAGLRDSVAVPIDFYGANGLYFWELFFHTPFLVAESFAAVQDFESAITWLHYLFDPSNNGVKSSSSGEDNATPAFWNVVPLLGADHPAVESIMTPSDPDAIAYAAPSHYRKSVFHAYIAALTGMGDGFYRQLTRDGLTVARVQYAQALALLGPRPDGLITPRWSPLVLNDLVQTDNAELRQREFNLTRSELRTLRAVHGKNDGTLRAVRMSAFRLPFNKDLLKNWDVLEARLYTLRHNLTIDGAPMYLPLYDMPRNPMDLLRMRSDSLPGDEDASTQSLTIMPYRFTSLLSRGYGLLEMVAGFEQALLGYLERGDQARREELQAQQALEMSNFNISLQRDALDGLNADFVALQASRDTVQQRYDWYQTLSNEGLLPNEINSLDLRSKATSIHLSAQVMEFVAASLDTAPNIFGLADGGIHWGALTKAQSLVTGMASSAMQSKAERLGQSSQYERRDQDWQWQVKQAQKEMDAIDKQAAALQIRINSARTGVQQALAQQDQLKAMLVLYSGRFTNAALYQWLSSQMAELYQQAYSLAHTFSVSIQEAWHYEMANFKPQFIPGDLWATHRRGLLSVDALKLALRRMEIAFITQNERKFEILKTWSLKRDFQAVFDEGVVTGKFSFSIGESAFTEDYENFGARQIKSVLVTLPTLLGPYQNITAVLTQVTNTLRDVDGNEHVNLRSSQQIALSTGLNESGMFALNFDDERYLPFEGTGVESSWLLEFTNLKSGGSQRKLLDDLTDVIVQMKYTAKALSPKIER